MAVEIDLSRAGQGIVQVSDFPDIARAPIRTVLREEVRALARDWRAVIRAGGGRPALPGAPPHSQSGNLEASFRVRLPRTRRNVERASVETAWPRVAHAHLLESGTRRMLPRPFAVPTARLRYGEFVARIEAALEGAVQETNVATRISSQAAGLPGPSGARLPSGPRATSRALP
jgi:hypothetical protein